MDIIARIKDRRARLSSGEGRSFLDVPEWGEDGAPLRIYWKPITPLDVSKSKFRESPRGSAEMVALKAEDAGGNRLFPDLGDADVLYTQADAGVVGRIAVAMAATPDSAEEAEAIDAA
jgi:hypothetical protein